MSKSTKKYLNMNLANILTPISHKSNKIGNSPFNISNKKSFKNNIERINKVIQKETSSKKNKDKLLDLILKKMLSIFKKQNFLIIF